MQEKTIVARVFLKIIFRGCPIIHSLSNGTKKKKEEKDTKWSKSQCKDSTRIGRSSCFQGLICCDRTWLLFLGVHIRLLTQCKICFTLGLSNYFSLKSLSLCLKVTWMCPKVNWFVDYRFIVWFKLWIY